MARLNFSMEGEEKAGFLKVLFVTHNYTRFRGDFAGVFLHLLARKLRENGVEVVVVAPHDASIPEEETIDGIKICRFRYAKDKGETLAYRGNMHGQILRNPFKIFRLIKFLRSAYRLSLNVIQKEDIKVVSVHWIFPAGVVGYYLKRKLGDRIRLFLSSHGTDIRLLRKMKAAYRFFKPVVRRAEAWTVVSNFLKDQIAEIDKSAVEKVKVIPLPNDESLFYPDDRVTKEQDLVVAVSRLTTQKRLSHLIEAVKLVSSEIAEIRLEIYGIGPEKANLTELIIRLGLEGQVRICDPVPHRELKKVYNRATIVVLNSFQEGFGLALTEAMLCRTAVIGVKSGGITDIIENNETGLVVPLDDSGELAGAIKRLMRDTAQRERLAEAGYEKALKNFSSASSARQYAELFKGK